jgi:small-conductance mechanosensitive channel
MPTLEQFIYAFGILVIAFFLSSFVVVILGRTKKLTSISRTNLDDLILSHLTRPIHIGFQLAGIVLALFFLFPDLVIYGYGYETIIFVVLVIWGGYTISRIIQALVHWYEKNGEEEEGQKSVFGFLESIIRLAIWSLAFLFLLNHFGVDISALLAGFGIAGIAVALALQNSLSGVFSAVSLVIDKPIRNGDFVTLDDGTEGFVEDISMRSTQIRTFANNTVIVPNTKLTQMVITNHFLPDEEVGIVLPLSVAYDSDLEKVEELTIEVAKNVLAEYPGVEDFEPIVRFKEFGDSGIKLILIARSKTFLDKNVVKHELIKALHKAFGKNKIEIPYPQLDVRLEQLKK